MLVTKQLTAPTDLYSCCCCFLIWVPSTVVIYINILGELSLLMEDKSRIMLVYIFPHTKSYGFRRYGPL